MVDGYYGQPLLKPPVWTWEVPVYFFAGGTAGVAAAMAAVGALAGADPSLVRDARWIAAVGGLLSPILLISDLGRPSRFLNMLRVFKARSPMSVGAWTLACFTPAVLAALLWGPVAGDPGAGVGLRIVGHAASLVGAIAGLVLATYTGVLISVTTVPVWAVHARMLPVHFGASSLGSAVSVLELAGHVTPAMNALGMAAAAAVTLAWARVELGRHPSDRPLTSGPSGRITRTGEILAGPLALVLRLGWASSTPVRLVAAASAIVGSLVGRFGWIAAGRASVALLVAGLLAVPLAAVDEQQRLDLSTRSLVAAASKYVGEYQEAFRFLLADETSVQTVYDAGGLATAKRRMTGELFLTYLAGDAAWIAVHDVAEVDGVPVEGRDDLRALLQKGDVRGVAARVADRNARFNIGRPGRNFNEPTLALLLLGPKRVKGVAFERLEVAVIDGRTRVTLGFRERERPTLVRSLRGAPIYSRGTLTIDAATGRIERTRLDIVDPGVSARLETEYAPDPKLELWVPVRFRERYEDTRERPHETVGAEAMYTNYRRFEVVGRIKKHET